MANLGDHDISEKSRVIAIVLLTFGSIVATTALIALTGQWWVYQSNYDQPVFVRLSVHLALWGGFMFAFSRARAVGRGFAFAITKSLELIAIVLAIILLTILRLCAAVVRLSVAAPAAALRIILGPGYDVLSAQVRMQFDPLLRWTSALARRFAQIRERIARIRTAIGKERTLREAYRTEFRDQFASYRAFRAQFEAMGRAEEARKEKEEAEPFRVACRLLGLPEDGGFSESAFKARYRALMKSLHPDVAGPNARATEVNAASVIIKERKGWS